MIVILDPGHGMSNRRSGTYDPGACSGKITEAGIAMEWTNCLRDILRARKIAVVRTRVDSKDPAPVSQRAAIASRYKGDLLLSIHCNAADGKANGTETFYRGEANKAFAERLNLSVVNALGTQNRGAKTESSSQHARLAIMAFQPCFLIELGFIDNAGDLAKMMDLELMRRACLAIAEIIA